MKDYPPALIVGIVLAIIVIATDAWIARRWP